MKITLLVVDDHAVVRAGLHALLVDSEIGIVGEAATGKQAIELASKLQPDVVLLDIRIPDLDGLAAMGEIHDRSPRSKVVIFTAYENPIYLARAKVMGARGYLLKGATRDEIVNAITSAHTGVVTDDGCAANLIWQPIRSWPSFDEEGPITGRERQVLRHVALGLSNREIGRTLEISPETVKEHVEKILRKLEVADRTEAAVWAVRNGLV